mmetsp:Transcript_1661/g.1154  ORF Transcript_1661/g.1154 Transcript_1661/m.1154 type:complete len:210 (-) Transcript_1661:808-1437(-)
MLCQLDQLLIELLLLGEHLGLLAVVLVLHRRQLCRELVDLFLELFLGVLQCCLQTLDLLILHAQLLATYFFLFSKNFNFPGAGFFKSQHFQCMQFLLFVQLLLDGSDFVDQLLDEFVAVTVDIFDVQQHLFVLIRTLILIFDSFLQNCIELLVEIFFLFQQVCHFLMILLRDFPRLFHILDFLDHVIILLFPNEFLLLHQLVLSDCFLP